MNKKALLLTIFAAAFSAATFASEVTITELAASQEVTVDVKPLAALKKVIDQDILNHCTETNSALCQEFLPVLMALTNQIDLDANAEIAFEELHNALKAELNNLSNPTTILEDVAAETEEVAAEVCTALMVVQQNQN